MVLKSKIANSAKSIQKGSKTIKFVDWFGGDGSGYRSEKTLQNFSGEFDSSGPSS